MEKNGRKNKKLKRTKNNSKWFHITCKRTNIRQSLFRQIQGTEKLFNLLCSLLPLKLPACVLTLASGYNITWFSQASSLAILKPGLSKHRIAECIKHTIMCVFFINKNHLLMRNLFTILKCIAHKTQTVVNIKEQQSTPQL